MKKKHIVETENEANKVLKVKASQKMRIFVNRVDKKSSKLSVPISSLVSQSLSNIQALLINMNIVILVLYLLQISFKL